MTGPKHIQPSTVRSPSQRESGTLSLPWPDTGHGTLLSGGPPTRRHVSPCVCNRLGDVSLILSLTNLDPRTKFASNDCPNKADGTRNIPAIQPFPPVEDRIQPDRRRTSGYLDRPGRAPRNQRLRVSKRSGSHDLAARVRGFLPWT